MTLYKLKKKGMLTTLSCFLEDFQWALDGCLTHQLTSDKENVTKLISKDSMETLTKITPDDIEDVLTEIKPVSDNKAENLTTKCTYDGDMDDLITMLTSGENMENVIKTTSDENMEDVIKSTFDENVEDIIKTTSDENMEDRTKNSSYDNTEVVTKTTFDENTEVVTKTTFDENTEVVTKTTFDENTEVVTKTTFDENTEVVTKTTVDENTEDVTKTTVDENTEDGTKTTVDDNTEDVIKTTFDENTEVVNKTTFDENTEVVTKTTFDENTEDGTKTTFDESMEDVIKTTFDENMEDRTKTTVDENMEDVIKTTFDENMEDVVKNTFDENLEDGTKTTSDENTEVVTKTTFDENMEDGTKTTFDENMEVVTKTTFDENMEDVIKTTFDGIEIGDTLFEAVLDLDDIVSASEEESDDDGQLYYSNMMKNWSKLEKKRINQSEEEDQIVDVNEDESDEVIDVITDEGIFRDEQNPEIFTRRIMKSKDQKRVYNSVHCCYYCEKMLHHIRPHLKAKHCHIKEVADAFSSSVSGNEQPLNLLRAKGDDNHNKKVIECSKGELLLFRRPTKKLNSTEYGPCPNCLEWISKNNLKRHQIKCIGCENSIGKQSKKNLLLQSDLSCGRFPSQCSDLLKKEVFSIMMVDNVADVAKKDILIIALGEYWIRQNIDNTYKRAHYSSQRMRLAARLLIELRKLVSDETLTLWDFIKPKYFDAIVQASLNVAVPSEQDEEELGSPSNCIKLKYDILRLTNFKWCLTIKSRIPSDEDRKDCKHFLHLMTLEFKTRVTKLAYTVIMKRQLIKTKDIPNPADIELLNKHLISELQTNLLNQTKEDYVYVVKLIQCRLLCYNKRRSGEIDAISVKSYSTRRKDLSDVDKSLIGELSALEKYLLETQDLMMVRGKRGRPVPVLIPLDCKKGLNFLSNPSVRQKVGIEKENQYLFPNSVMGASRCYESLKKICSDLNLQNPENINSVTLRKYTATLSQVIDLSPNQLEWVCKHLGHTKRVHTEHYQQMSGFIERTSISKLLLIQDLNLTKQYAGKKLDEISFEDLVTSTDTLNNDSDDESSIPNVATKRHRNSDSDSEYEPEISQRKQSKKGKGSKRIRWTSEQIQEIETLFPNHLKNKTTPGKKECLKIQKCSEILKVKHYTDIVKKISNMNHKKK